MSTGVKIIDIRKEKENGIIIEFSLDYRFNKCYPDVIHFMDKSFPVWFCTNNEINYTDNIYRKESEFLYNEKITLTEFVNDNNIIIEYLGPETFDRKYAILLDLKKHTIIKNNLLSVNYTKNLHIPEGGYTIIIDLNYKPDERAVKINRIMDNIKSNKIDYDI